jgi:phage gp36-like protein
MPYCTLDDLKKSAVEATLIQLTDDDGSTGAIVQDKIDDAISFADQLIDGNLSGRYTLPLPSVPGLIKNISIDLAIFHLYARRPELEITETILFKYKNSVKLLEQIRDGLLKLGIESPDSGPGSGEYRTNKTADDRVFSKTNLKGY